jgi:colanic acid biosynthesis glycosyl transferase WcaI
MKVLIWGINYAPEVTGIAVYNTMMAEALANRQVDVEVVTGFPYYPQWKKNSKDQGTLYRKERAGRVTLHRLIQYVPKQVTARTRMLHELSFVVSSFLRVLTLPRADVMVVVSPPLLLGAAAWLIRCLKHQPYLLHIQDLQPDAAAGLGMLKQGFLLKALYRLEHFAYQRANCVSGISKGMLRAFEQKGVPASKRYFFPNPVELPEADQMPPRGVFRKRHGIGLDVFVCLYSGNIGHKQGLGILLDAAELLSEQETILILICGDGAARKDLKDKAESRLIDNIHFLPLEPQETFSQLLCDADVCLVPQMRGSGAAFFPSKLLSILAHGRPAVTVSDEESVLAAAQRTGNFGINIHPGDAQGLAKTLVELAADPEARQAYGARGRAYVEQFSAKNVLEDFFQILKRLCK